MGGHMHQKRPEPWEYWFVAAAFTLVIVGIFVNIGSGYVR